MTRFEVGMWVAVAAVVSVIVLYEWSRKTGAVLLTGAEIPKLLAGNTLKDRGYSFFYASDGTARGNVLGYRDTGVWSAREDGYCEEWTIWGEGKTLCWQVWRSGDATIERKSTTGPGINHLTWHAGNFDDL